MSKDIDVAKLLPKPLNDYINEKHTQEECSGFIDGFEKAIDLVKNGYLHLVSGCLSKEELHKELKEYAQWYQMDDLRRKEKERFDSIIDRYITERK